jgi:hypothetical protein
MFSFELRSVTGESVGGRLAPWHVTIGFHLESQSCDVAFRGRDSSEPRMDVRDAPVVTDAGTPVEIADLFVGATVVVMGRRLTLLACERATGTPSIHPHVVLLCILSSVSRMIDKVAVCSRLVGGVLVLVQAAVPVPHGIFLGRHASAGARA